MKLFVLDNYGSDGMLDFCLRALGTGHDVKWYFTRDDKNREIGKGLVDRVFDDWRKWALWADLVVLADNTKHLVAVDQMRKAYGIRVIGATAETAQWELDRLLGQNILKQHGIKVPSVREFKDYDTAIAYVKREGRRFVSKPCYDETDKALSYVSKSPADLVYMLQRWKKSSKLKGSFILQEFVGGCEMAVGGWIGPHGFNRGWCENWEFKKLMVGDLGPATGEMGTVLRYVAKSKLADMVLKPLEQTLIKAGYVGYIDVNCIIDDAGTPWPLEFTCRMGYPLWNIQQALNTGDPVQWLADLAAGRDAHSQSLNEVAVGVVLAIPDFPYSHITRKEVVGVPIYHPPALREHMHPCSVMLGEAPNNVKGKVVNLPTWLTAGDYVLVVTGTGASVSEARRQAYSVLDKIETPSSPFWRVDIGQRLKKQLPQIQARGFATRLSF